MKRMFLTLSISIVSLFAFAQPAADENNFAPDSSIITLQHDRIAKLEAEVKELKLSHDKIQKQFTQIKKQYPDLKKKKLIVNRVSSKGAAWVEQ